MTAPSTESCSGGHSWMSPKNLERSLYFVTSTLSPTHNGSQKRCKMWPFKHEDTPATEDHGIILRRECVSIGWWPWPVVQGGPALGEWKRTSQRRTFPGLPSSHQGRSHAGIWVCWSSRVHGEGGPVGLCNPDSTVVPVLCSLSLLHRPAYREIADWLHGPKHSCSHVSLSR